MPNNPTVPVDVKKHFNNNYTTEYRAQEHCENRGGLPGIPVPNKPTVSVDVNQHLNNNYTTVSELRSCAKVEVAVLGFPCLINLRFLWA